ncbi:methionine synthase [Methanospirillum hungatei]|uniref:methionine synthase n=1 Tax=Methanospirillum hungatei TaxID=2203 RepID=UPI0026EE115D|nr:methionine synthase [Methanospirillum hungatei]MCA1915337.1 methionine synthase [Methanospirillum hungatei]
MQSFIPDTILPTTVVGSYPGQPKRTLKNLFDPLHGAVEEAVSLQKKAGITIISDGQVRGDMIGAFASKLPGIRGSDVIGRVMPPGQAITIKDTAYAVRQHPYVKAIITGPSTLAYGLHLGTPLYRNRNELIPDIASSLVVEAQGLAKTGAVMLQIDEPILSTGAADLDVAKKAIATIAQAVSIPVCLHACGNIAHIIDDLLAMPIQILDFEGSVNAENLASLSGKDLKDRYIGYGIVDSSSQVLDSADNVKRRLWKGIDILGPERILPDPDCGLRMHTPESAYAKLTRLTGVVSEVRQEL